MSRIRTVFVFLAVSIPPHLFAQGETSPGAEKTLSPYFYVDDGDDSIDRFPLKSTDVSTTINGVIAEVTVKQRYYNDGSRPINGAYIFPASTRAAVHGMSMRIGDQIITARIKERDAAKQEFEQAKSEGKSASLLEQQRPNVFSMNVANVHPGDFLDIELRYTEYLVPTDGTYEFVYPTVVGPRYSNKPESSAPQSESWVKSPYQRQSVPPPSLLSITSIVSAGIPIQELSCPSHKTVIDWKNESTAAVQLDAQEHTGGNRDYILRYRLTGAGIESGLSTYKGATEQFFLLTVQPPERVSAIDIPPREYISSPVLTNIQVRYDGFDACDVEPSAIPDLFAKRPLTIVGKFRKSARGTITITGVTGGGNFTKVVNVAEARPLDANRALMYLWARTRIAALGDFAGDGDESERVKEITSLGLTYNLLTRYTSFIAVLEKVGYSAGKAVDVKQPLPLPQGVSNLAVGTAKVPEPGLAQLLGIAGLLLLLMPRIRTAAFQSKRVAGRGRS